MGPGWDVVENFTAITGLPENTATDWLKLYNNDPEKAVNAWIDDPDLLERKSARDMTVDIEVRLSILEHVTSTHPKRMPGPNGQLSIQDIEDQEIKEAINLSTSQTLPTQETGVTTADQPYFGPAREYPDTRNWQMTVSKATAKEIPLDPEPIERRRPLATPAFLRPTPYGHRLPGLVKILHTIPAAREALLSLSCIQSDYGSDSDWWNGGTIGLPHMVYEGAQMVASEQEIIYEAQRLMAFLDKTDRAYGSSDALAVLSGFREYQGNPIIDKFLAAWHNAMDHHDPGGPLNNVFSTTGVRFNDGTAPNTTETEVLELEVKEERFIPGQSLYEIIDSTLWPSRDGTELEEQVFLDRIADVLVIQICRGQGMQHALDVKVPPVWYADRYRQSAQPQVHKMFAAKTAAEEGIKTLDARKAKIAHVWKANYSGDTCALLGNAKQYFEKTVQYLKETEEAVPTESSHEGSNIFLYSKIIDELSKTSDRVARKLQELENSKATIQAHLRELSKLLTEPSDVHEESPSDRYTLRGVCAAPNIVYVQEKTQMETFDDMLNGEAEDWQWWKLQFECNHTTSFSCTKVRQVEVLKAVRDESPSAVLVYASDKAMSVENKELPPELKSFVQADNSLFAAELASSHILSASTANNGQNNNGSLSPQQETNETFRPLPQDRPLRSNCRSTDSSLPSYSSQPVYSSPRRDASYDDFIPSSLRHSSLDNDMDLDEGVEMMERDERGGGGRGALGPAYSGGEGAKGYQLGSYEPEIEMDDDDKGKEHKAVW
ncbi:MAG: hypothetical protein Q9204_000514 [Flavoplaca sp. TL-2023a]